MIEVKNLTKKYGEHVAVDDLSFRVKDGQVYGFLGPNGAGKTTTMNVMTGYLAATKGQVLINGLDIFEQAEQAKKHIGFLPEQPPLYPDMTPREYLDFVAELKKVDKSQKREEIKKAVAAVRIADVQDRLIKQLSKGYKQRVGLAGALIGDPEVLILDEPTSGLDPKQIIEMLALIKKLRRNRTIILSSHILSEVSAVCDTVLIINKGKLMACDTPQNLSNNMEGANIIKVTVKGDKEVVRSALSGCKNVKKIQVKGKKDGTAEAVITARGSVDIRADVSGALYKNGCAVLGMETYTMSLEDVFLQLTADREPAQEEKKPTRSKRQYDMKAIGEEQPAPPPAKRTDKDYALSQKSKAGAAENSGKTAATAKNSKHAKKKTGADKK